MIVYVLLIKVIFDGGHAGGAAMATIDNIATFQGCLAAKAVVDRDRNVSSTCVAVRRPTAP